MQIFDVAIIGAGVQGLSAAWQVASRGRSVVVLERFFAGHQRGSSHGRTRILRSIYSEPAYTRLMAVATSVDWPALEKAAQKSLRKPADSCFFGPPGELYEAYEGQMRGRAGVEILSAAEGAKRFPQFDWAGMAGGIQEAASAVILAEATLKALTQLAVQEGAVVRYGCSVADIDRFADGPVILQVESSTGHEVVHADRLVVAAGAWTAELFGPLGRELSVARQQVGFFSIEGQSQPLSAQDFPVWAYLGHIEDAFYYGLPDVGGQGLKVGRHGISGGGDDPNEDPGVSEVELEAIERFVRQRLRVPLGARLSAQTCLYTNREDENFIIDHHPRRRSDRRGRRFFGPRL